VTVLFGVFVHAVLLHLGFSARADLIHIAQTRFGIEHRIGNPKKGEILHMTPNPKDQGWYGIAEEASKEMDGAKLTILVAQLCSALDDRDNGLHQDSPLTLSASMRET
jgi:hypothetical protein